MKKVALVLILYLCMLCCFADINKWTKHNFIDEFDDVTDEYYLQGVSEDQSAIVIGKERVGFILPTYVYYDKWIIKTKVQDGTINEFPARRSNNNSIEIVDKFYVDLFLSDIIYSCKVIIMPENGYSSEKINLGEVSISYELVSGVYPDFYFFSVTDTITQIVSDAVNSVNNRSQMDSTSETSSIDTSAVSTAKSYLKYSAFSRKGLIDQLIYEGYSNSTATNAVDSLNVNWNEQAVKSAQNYLRYSSFSYSGLVSQLEYEGFTHSQAVYGVENSGAGLSDSSSSSSSGNIQQATKTAQSYLRYSGFSRKGLIDQLVFEGFSKSEATSAVDSLNVDWNEQAVKVAQSYRSWSNMTNSELKDQLIYEGFTSSQAQYGISH